MQREHETELGPLAGQPRDALGDPLQAVAPVLTAVRGHHHDPRVALDELGDPRIVERDVEAGRPLQRVDPGVAADEDLVGRDVLAHQVLLVVGRRRVVHRGDARDQLAVELLREGREVVAPGPQPGLDVPDRDPQMERRQRGGEGGARVAVHEHDAWKVAAEHALASRPLTVDVSERGAEVVLEAAHERRHARVEARVAEAHPQVDVRGDAGESEHLLHHRVVLAARHDDRRQRRALAQREDERHELDRFRSRAHHHDDAECRSAHSGNDPAPRGAVITRAG